MKNQRKIDLIVVHCSATRINQDFPVEALEACHKARGFHSIGYHYYITKDGVVYPSRHSHSSPESISGRPPLQSRPRLSRCRDPRSSRPSLGSQELSLLRCQGMAEGNRLPSLESPDSSQVFVLFELFVFKIIPACSNTGWDFFFVYSHHFSPPSALSSHLAYTFLSPKNERMKGRHSLYASYAIK